jgi:hypothetical protein
MGRSKRQRQTHALAPAHKVRDLAMAWNQDDEVIRRALRAGRVRGFRIGREWLVTDAEKQRVERGEVPAE